MKLWYILFKQTRVGEDKQLFKIHESRSMWTETPNVRTNLLSDLNHFITKMRAFLRKISIDEVPQV